MATYSLTGMVLKRTKLGETDSILTLLTDKGTLQQAVAKGARKPGSKFGGRAEPLTVIEALVAKGKSLDIITDVKTVETHALVRNDYDSMMCASVVLEFLFRSVQEGMTEQRLYQMTLTWLDVCADVLKTKDKSNLQLLLSAFLIKAISIIGFRPELTVCASCFEALDPTDDGVIFRADAGGVLCAECASPLPTGTPVGSDTIEWLSFLLSTPFVDIAHVDCHQPASTVLFELVAGFVESHIPARLITLDMYRSLGSSTVQ